MYDKDKPVILLNMAVDIHSGRECEILISQYAQRVSDSGAVPMLMPSLENREIMDTLLNLADGVLLIGGKDYHPKYYGCTPVPETNLTRMRPHFDLAFGQAVLEHDMPVLGICAGCQLLNIITGGKLIQHLPNAEKHTAGVFHSAKITEDGFASRCLGLKTDDSFTVNSFHHQAADVQHIGNGLKITAAAFDGTPEIIEMPGERMIMGVQFHPERMDDIGPMFFRLLKEEAVLFRKNK